MDKYLNTLGIYLNIRISIWLFKWYLNTDINYTVFGKVIKYQKQCLFWAVQYRQNVFPIAHYHNWKTSLAIHVVQKITIIRSQIWYSVVATSGGTYENLNIGTLLHIIPYKKPPKHFWKLHGLIDFRCAQTLALPYAFGTICFWYTIDSVIIPAAAEDSSVSTMFLCTV